MIEIEDSSHFNLSASNKLNGNEANTSSNLSMKERVGNKVTTDISVLEEMFKDRYTNADAEYVRILNLRAPLPPCVSDWYSRPRRSFDYTRGRGRGGGGHNDRGSWHHHGDNRSHDYQQHGDSRRWRDERRDQRDDYNDYRRTESDYRRSQQYGGEPRQQYHSRDNSAYDQQERHGNYASQDRRDDGIYDNHRRQDGRSYHHRQDRHDGDDNQHDEDSRRGPSRNLYAGMKRPATDI